MDRMIVTLLFHQLIQMILRLALRSLQDSNLIQIVIGNELLILVMLLIVLIFYLQEVRQAITYLYGVSHQDADLTLHRQVVLAMVVTNTILQQWMVQIIKFMSIPHCWHLTTIHLFQATQHVIPIILVEAIGVMAILI